MIGTLFPAQTAADITPQSYTVLVKAETQTSPAQIHLIWQPDSDAAKYEIYRKDPKGDSWGSAIATLPGSANDFLDSNVLSVAAYEYQIVKTLAIAPYPGGDPSQWIRGYGYICVGLLAPAIEQRGKVILIIDDSFLTPLANEIATLEQDLTGDGWIVIPRPMSRQASIGDVKQLILNEYNADPTDVRTVFLLGHIAVPYSGDLNADFHPDHKGAWPADAFYGDVSGVWTDNSVSDNSSDYVWNHNVPGDGKFDQSELPAIVQLEIGRVDLADLPSFAPLTEVDLMRRYLNKDHGYRHGLYTAPARALIRDNFGVISGDAPATTAWRNFAPFVGPENIVSVGYNNYFSTLATTPYLWSYAGGGGSFTHADGVGSTQDFVTSDPKTIFLMLHGSYFGDWNTVDNFLRAPLGTSFGLASAWTGLPHWFLHHMGIGETIGYSTRLTQNNHANGLYKNAVNSFAGDVHVALMGDPTLRLHVVAPARNLRAIVNNAVTVAWDPSVDNVLGYSVYRSSSPAGPFTRLGRGYLSGTSFTDLAAPPGSSTYMIRAVKLQSSPSGTYYNLSQGIFTTVNAGNGALPTVFVQASGSPSEQGPISGTFTISRIGSATQDLTVHFHFEGSAQNGVDFQMVNPSVVIPAGQNMATIAINPMTDQDGGGDESLTLVIDPDPAYVVGNLSRATLTIHDSPPEPLNIASFQIDSTGHVEIAISASAGEGYRLEASPDLFHWTTVATGTIGADGMMRFEEPEPKNVATRFYRISRL